MGPKGPELNLMVDRYVVHKGVVAETEEDFKRAEAELEYILEMAKAHETRLSLEEMGQVYHMIKYIRDKLARMAKDVSQEGVAMVETRSEAGEQASAFAK